MSPSLRDRLSSGAKRGAQHVVRRGLRPTISVVVEARGRADDVRASIDSVRDQPGRRLEIVVVLVEESLRELVGSVDDWRVRVVEAVGAGPAEARRAGAEAARGDRLLFLAARQELVALSGPTSMRQHDGGPSHVPVGVTLAHALVPRDLWSGLPDDGEPTGQTMAMKLVGDGLADLGPVVRDRGPARPQPFEPQTDPMPGLEARTTFDAVMLEETEDRAAIAAGLLARDLPPFLDAVERCDDEQWARLQAHVADLVREAGAALADVPVEDRVAAWLVAEGRRDDAVAYVASRRFTRGQFPTDVRDGLIRAELGVSGVPDHVLAVTEAESPLEVRIASVTEDAVILWLGIARLDEQGPEVTVAVDSGRSDVSTSADPAVTRWMGEPFQRHDHGVVEVRWPPGEGPHPTADGTFDEVRLEIEVVNRGVRRETWLDVGLDDIERSRLRSTDTEGGRRPDLADDEAGPYRQHLLQQEYARVAEPLDPHLVYFQAFGGQAPTDHPGAIQAALHARATGVRMLWAVADRTVSVPDGAEPVVLRSREWYDALARAAYVVTNVELDPWFVRREGQEVLQTYHGYPSKAMGLMQWQSRDLVPTHVAEMLRRTSGTWNTLLTPIPEMDGYYRDNYEFQGRIISQGYPRDDSLVAPGHEEIRARTRQQLGIRDDQTAVLYAPTWRDDLATNFRSARAVLHLDVEQAARELGESHVLLLRGHRFHAPRAKQRVVDVTAHPEVNDLILAADVAVLDYSSMRFDIALTGTPMVFLVPDLDDYTRRTRGFLFPFEDSAPGPFVETTAEVVGLLRDVPALRRDWADRIAAFNARYQPLSDGHAAERVVAEFFAPLLDGR